MFLLLVVVIIACTSEKEPAPSNCTDPPDINLVSTTDAGCNLSNGIITVAGTGGSGNLFYSINGGDIQSSPIFTDLPAGVYTVEVSDENNCTTSIQATIVNEDGLNIELAVIGTICGENQGSINVTASGAQGAVEYKLNNGAFQSSNNFPDLAQGGYTLIARDASGCEIEQEVDITTGVTFGAVNLIVQNDCAVSGCHNGSQSPDLRTSASIIANANRIKIRTANGSMPAGGRSLSDEEIATIACWVDDGAKGN